MPLNIVIRRWGTSTPYYHRHMDHPYDGDAPNNSIDPTLDGGAPMAAVVAVNTTNGRDLLFNASVEMK